MKQDINVSIHVQGQDRTQQVKDWSIWWNDEHSIPMLKIRFHSNKSFTCPLGECRITPTRELSDVMQIKRGRAVASAIDRAVIYGEKYALIRYRESDKFYIQKLDDHIDFIARSSIKDGDIFSYFVTVAHAREEHANTADRKAIAANVVSQLNKLPPRSDTALHAYCTRQLADQPPSRSLIYPFGVNASQLVAVERALSSQISVIEGPPGTGKTQTILNIIANVVVQCKTVAILSNNNAAVDNVYEKLEKSGVDHLVARMGSKELRQQFFDNQPPVPKHESEQPPELSHIQGILEPLRNHLHELNTAAQLQAKLDELSIERRHLLHWQKDNDVPVTDLHSKYRLSPSRTTDLIAHLSRLGGQRIGLRDRLALFLNFRILRTGPFGDQPSRQAFIHALQIHFYDQTIRETTLALAECRASMTKGNFEAGLRALTDSSMIYLKHYANARVLGTYSFGETDYRQNFDAFMKRFPILGSGTHSVVNSIARDAVLDYVIIDEASLQDILPGILAMGCARNLVIVGDRRQLPHIPLPLGIAAPADEWDCEKHSLLDSCLAVFGDAVPVTLLKEHYRCHPRIIQFCNQQFYDNQLIPMTRDNGEPALRLVVTAKGQHTRGNTNQRELDSILQVLESDEELVWEGDDGRGFIAPFRAQVKLSGECLPKDFIGETVHKFQGRECDEIVFSTVLGKHCNNTQLMDFVDNPCMVNVAVSRAKRRFTLVTGDEAFAAKHGPIAALVRYISYYANDDHVHRAPVVSAFDLLYGEYDKSLERLNAKLRPTDSTFKSEQIVAQLLRQALSAGTESALTFHSQVALNKVVSIANPALSDPERTFLANQASCDFVIYFKVGKTPMGVIEVDGGSHELPEQIRRDRLKDSILMKCNIPILRLRTVESRVEERIAEFIGTWTSAAVAS